MHVVDETGDWDVFGDKGRGLSDGHVFVDALVDIGEREKVDAGGSFAGIRAEIFLQFVLEVVVGEGQHAAIGVMNDDDFAGTEQLVRNRQRSQRIGGTAASIANDVCVTFRESERFCRIDPRIHANEHGNLAARRHRQVALVEVSGILFVGGEEFRQDRNRIPLSRSSALLDQDLQIPD
jgi:hypothetical protein